MDDIVVVRHLENLDRRLANVEQILPQLATKEELRAAIALLATKEELQAAIAPLATRAELRAEGERLQRHMDIVGEALRSDIQLLAEHLASVLPRGSGTS